MNLTEDLLQRGLTDIIPLSEMISVARRHGFERLEDIRENVISSLATMLRDGWIILGDAVEKDGLVRVHAWSLSPSDTVSRLRREWEKLEEVRPGDVCWLELTEAGRRVAESN
jgi:hypothetical protein